MNSFFKLSIVFAFFFALGEACTDSVSSCASWKANGFCTNPFYNDATRSKYCAQSCNLCATSTSTKATTSGEDSTESTVSGASEASTSSSTTTKAACVDSVKVCSSWAANGYCTNSFYNDTDRKKNCAKTCGLC